MRKLLRSCGVVFEGSDGRRLAQIVTIDEILKRGEIFDGRLRRVERQLREALEGVTESWRVPKELEVRVHRSVKGRDQENGLDASTARIWNEHEAGIVNDLRLIQARLHPFHQAVISGLRLELRDGILLDRDVEREWSRHRCYPFWSVKYVASAARGHGGKNKRLSALGFCLWLNAQLLTITRQEETSEARNAPESIAAAQ